MPPLTAKVPGAGSTTLSYTIPGDGLDVETVYATIDATAAAAGVTAEITITDQAGVVIARRAQTTTIPAGATGTATWALRLDDDGSGSGYTTVQDEGVALPQERTLDFVGAGVTAADDAGNARTTVTVPGGSPLGVFFGVAGWQSGWFYGPPFASFPAGAGNTPVGRLFCDPIWCPGVTLQNLAFQQVSFSSTSTYRVGIYADNGFGYPGALVFDSGAIVISGAGGVRLVTCTNTLAPGLYWLAWVASVGSGVFFTSYTAGITTVLGDSSLSRTGSSKPYARWYLNGVSGVPLPDPFTAGGFPTSLASIALWMQVA